LEKLEAERAEREEILRQRMDSIARVEYYLEGKKYTWGVKQEELDPKWGQATTREVITWLKKQKVAIEALSKGRVLHFRHEPSRWGPEHSYRD
jgi:hypothetical protein